MPSTFIHNVRIFDGDAVLSSDGCILIENGLISTVSSVTPELLAEADEVINGAEHTVLPGLIDAHVHCHEGVGELKQALRFGVTTVLDMFSDPEHVRKLRKVAGERNDLSDLRSSCYGATVEGGWPAAVLLATMGDKAHELIAKYPKLKTPSEAEEFVKNNVKQGASYIKLFQEDGSSMKGQDAGIPTPSPELQAAVVEAAHKHGLITLSHALTQKSTLAVLKAGTDGLAHCFCDEKPSKELLDAYKKNNSFLVPTLIVAATLTGEELASSNDFVRKDAVKKLASEEARECFCRRMMMGKEGCSVEFAYEVVKMLKAEGIDIVAGTDTATGLAGTAFGLSLHQELSLYTDRCGFTPLEALRSATSTSARRFGMKDRGLLKEGMRADLLMVKGNPTVDIGDAMNITRVWRGGVKLEE